MSFKVEVLTETLPVLYRVDVRNLLKKAVETVLGMGSPVVEAIFDARDPGGVPLFTFSVWLGLRDSYVMSRGRVSYMGKEGLVEIFEYAEGRPFSIFVSCLDCQVGGRTLEEIFYEGFLNLIGTDYQPMVKPVGEAVDPSWKIKKVVGIEKKPLPSYLTRVELTVKASTVAVQEAGGEIPDPQTPEGRARWEGLLLEEAKRTVGLIRGELPTDLGVKIEQIVEKPVKYTAPWIVSGTTKLWFVRTCILGTFVLTGSPKDLEVLLMSGLGEDRDKGFGMIWIPRARAEVEDLWSLDRLLAGPAVVGEVY